MSPPAAPGFPEHLGDAAERLAAFEILERERKLPPPVRMLFDRARNVDLLALAHDVVECNRHEARGRLRQVRGDGASSSAAAFPWIPAFAGMSGERCARSASAWRRHCCAQFRASSLSPGS